MDTDMADLRTVPVDTVVKEPRDMVSMVLLVDLADFTVVLMMPEIVTVTMRIPIFVRLKTIFAMDIIKRRVPY